MLVLNIRDFDHFHYWGCRKDLRINERRDQLLSSRGVRHGVSKGVEHGCSPPAMQTATSAGGHLKAVSGMAAHRALKGRAWRALAIL